MNIFRALCLVLVLTAGLALLTGTVGFDTSSMDRGVSTEIVRDTGALIGYEAEDISVNSSSQATLVTVENRLNVPLTVTNILVTSSEKISVKNTTGPEITPGEMEGVEADIKCAGAEAEVTENVAVTLRIDASPIQIVIGGKTAVRMVEVTCTP